MAITFCVRLSGTQFFAEITYIDINYESFNDIEYNYIKQAISLSMRLTRKNLNPYSSKQQRQNYIHRFIIWFVLLTNKSIIKEHFLCKV